MKIKEIKIFNYIKIKPEAYSLKMRGNNWVIQCKGKIIKKINLADELNFGDSKLFKDLFCLTL